MGKRFYGINYYVTRVLGIYLWNTHLESVGARRRWANQPWLIYHNILIIIACLLINRS